MKTGLLFALVGLVCIFASVPAQADDWRSNYSTGRVGEDFEACCGVKDCRTAQSLGYPRMRRLEDGGYDVKVGKHWIHYDFPAIHRSEDKQAWVCYMETSVEPEPLCLFLPPGII